MILMSETKLQKTKLNLKRIISSLFETENLTINRPKFMSLPPLKIKICLKSCY